MTIWQRAIAIILLAVFTPVAVLAGTSLRVCVGDDGHRAIEFVIAAGHHNAAEDVGVANCESRTDIGHSVPECSDAPLLSVAQNASASAKIKPFAPLDDFPAAVLVPVAYEATSVGGGYRYRVFLSSTLRRDAQLDAMRTVVLQI